VCACVRERERERERAVLGRRGSWTRPGDRKGWEVQGGRVSSLIAGKDPPRLYGVEGYPYSAEANSLNAGFGNPPPWGPVLRSICCDAALQVLAARRFLENECSGSPSPMQRQRCVLEQCVPSARRVLFTSTSCGAISAFSELLQPVRHRPISLIAAILHLLLSVSRW